jgi:hypothetical protein
VLIHSATRVTPEPLIGRVQLQNDFTHYHHHSVFGGSGRPRVINLFSCDGAFRL